MYWILPNKMYKHASKYLLDFVAVSWSNSHHSGNYVLYTYKFTYASLQYYKWSYGGNVARKVFGNILSNVSYEIYALWLLLWGYDLCMTHGYDYTHYENWEGAESACKKLANIWNIIGTPISNRY